MSTLTLQSLAARDLHGYDAPSASGTSQAAVTHLAVAAVIVVTVIVAVLAVLIRAATGRHGLVWRGSGRRVPPRGRPGGRHRRARRVAGLEDRRGDPRDNAYADSDHESTNDPAGTGFDPVADGPE
jgi:hypothetical protein